MHFRPCHKRLRCLIALASLTLFALHTYAQSTEPDLKARLLKKPLYLRGFWKEDKLKFDIAGKLTVPSVHAPFPLCGIEIDHVKLQKDKLVLSGGRMALKFKPTLERIPLFESVHIEIAGTPGTDFGPALDSIFADGLADLTPSLPPYWQKYAQKTFLNAAAPASPESPASTPQTTADAQTIPAQQSPEDSPSIFGKGVTVPVVLSQPEPVFTHLASQMKYGGNVTLHFIVKKDGAVSDVSILSPLGLGLDEQAIGALYQSRFKPAMEGNMPVACYLNVDFNFF
jgi:TonB family protein